MRKDSKVGFYSIAANKERAEVTSRENLLAHAKEVQLSGDLSASFNLYKEAIIKFKRGILVLMTYAYLYILKMIKI